MSFPEMAWKMTEVKEFSSISQSEKLLDYEVHAWLKLKSERTE